MKLLLLRPYYGITISSDMMGDLGIADHMPHVFPDLSLVYAATIAKNDRSVELDVIDANAEKLFPKETLRKMKDHYDIIILKAAAPTIKYDIEFLKCIKSQYKNSKAVISGHISRVLKNWIREHVPEIDDIADMPTEYYVNNLIEKKLPSLHINEFPTPDYTLFPYDKYVAVDGTLRGCLHLSRGCAAGCAYCPYASFYGKKFEFRSVDKVIEDIKYLLSLGIKIIQFRDQYFSADKEKVFELCRKIIDQGLKFEWFCETRLESLNTELIDIMVKAGMKFICFGVESASERLLESYRRPVYEIEKTKSLIEYLNKKKVITLAFYIVGFPEDTWDSVKETYELALKLRSICANFSVYVPCLTDGEFEKQHPDIEMTPDIFAPFENMLAINSSKNFTLEQLRNFRSQLTFLYQAHAIEMKDAFENHYHNQSKYDNAVDKLKTRLKDISIMEL